MKFLLIGSVGSLTLDSEKQIRESFEAIYSSSDSNYPDFDTARWPRNRYEAVLRVAPMAERILDVGCGNGLLMYNLRSRANELFGLEMARNRAKNARRELENRGVAATITEGNIEHSLEYSDHFFDVVVCVDTLQFVLNLWSAMTEISRVLVPGGCFIATVPNASSLRRRLNMLRGRFPATSAADQGFDVRSGAMYDDGTLHYFTFHTLEKLYRMFDISPVRRLGYGRFGRSRNWWPTLLSDGVCVVGTKNAL